MSVWTLRATGSRRAVDLDEVRRALSVLADPQHGMELRGLPSGRSVTFKGNDLVAAGQAAEQLASDDGIYYCLNPVPAGLNRAARVADILCRRWLLVDVDPVKPAEHKDDSATDDEHEAARSVASQVMDYLTNLGWPAPALVDSGNGWHLLYRVDLPADEMSRVLLKRLLHALADKFSGPKATIDRAVHNASRIAKLPGTWARKGKTSDDRPHRMCQLVYCPEHPEIVSAELISLAAGVKADKPQASQIEANGTHTPFTVKTSSKDGRAYARAALEREVARVVLAVRGPTGGANNALNTAAFSMGQLVAGGEILEQEVVAALELAASKAGLESGEIRPTISSGLEAGKLQPRTAPKDKGKARSQPEQDVEPGKVVIVRASAITPKKVEWLWPGRIPLGKLTTFAGVGGLGKTFVLCDITARVTRGLPWPDSAGECCEAGQVLFISGEDDPDDTLVPRMMELNADLERVAFLTAETQDNFTLAAVKVLTAAIGQLGNDTRLVVIDPPTSYLGDINDHKNAELRRLLTPLKNWAAEKRVAMIFNTHVNKPSGQKVEAMMRVMGSVAWVNAVRAAHMFTKDPEDHERRLFVGMKLNIGRERKGLAYKIKALPEDRATVEWLGEVDVTADEAMNREKPKRRVIASVWLEGFFQDRHEVPSNEIWKAKDEQTTLSSNALKEAKDEMGIQAKQVYGTDGEREWVWRWTPEAKSRWKAKAKSASEVEL